MAEIASAYVSLLPSARGMGRAIESEVGGEVDQAGVSLGRRLGAGIGKAAATAVATLTGVALAAGTVGIRTAAQLEQADIGFTTMLGSGERAQAFLSDLAGFAAKTPFEFPELQTAASSLVSAGVEADKVIPIMTSLGNATSGMGTGAEGVKRATVALQQMNAAGKITGEDLNQLRDAGIPVYDLLAAATGKSVEAVAELAQKGKLGREELEQLMSALETGAGLERFTGLMEKQSASLNGMWSTLKDTFSMGMADAVQPLIPLIKDGLGGANAFVAAQMPVLKQGLADLVVGAQGLYSLVAGGNYSSALRDAFGWGEDSAAVDRILDIRDAATGLYDLLIRGDYTGALSRAFGWEEDSGAVDTLLGIRDGVIEVGSAIGTYLSNPAAGEGLGTAFSSLGSSVATLLPAVQTFIAQMPSLTDVVTVGATALAFLADHSDLLVKAMPVLVGAVIAFKVAQLASNVALAASPAIRLLEVGAMKAQTAAMRELAVTQRLAAGSQLASNTATATGTAVTATNTTATIGQRIATLASATAARVAAAGQWLWNAALTANPIGIVIVAVAALVAALVWFFTQTEVGRKIVAAAWAGIQAAVQVVASWFTSTIPALWQSIAADTRAKWDAVVAFFKAIPGKIAAFFLNWTLPGLLIKHWSSIKSSAETKFGEVIAFVKGVPQKIADGLGSLGTKLASAGEDLMQGLITGIGNKVGSAVQAVKNAVQSVVDGAKNLLGIASPSKVFMEIGRNTGEGLRLGIEAEEAAIARASAALVSLPSVSRSGTAAVAPLNGSPGAGAGNDGGVHFHGNVGWDPDEVARRIDTKRRDAAVIAGVAALATVGA